jgi:hypothetical protein
MRKIMFILAVFGLAGSLWAAHPFEGTWKLNIAKSKPAPGQQDSVKDMMVVCKVIGADIETVFTGTGADAKPFEYKFAMPQHGGVLASAQQPAQSPAEASFIVITVIDPGNMYGTSIQKGKQVEVTHTFVSKDGKTMTRTSKSTDTQGKSTESLQVFDKQ